MAYLCCRADPMGINRSFNMVKVGIIALCAGAVLLGCGPKIPPSPEKVMLQEYKGAPDWVTRGAAPTGRRMRPTR